MYGVDADVRTTAFSFTMDKIQRITSPANPLIRLVSAVVHTQRRAVKEGLFTVEGLRLAEMAAASDWRIRHTLVTERALAGARLHALVESLLARDIPTAFVTEEIFANLAETDSPQGILLLMERRKKQGVADLSQSGYEDEPPLYIALDRVQDPGNVGTILRTADAVGVTGVILLRGSADVYSGKVVRATMGSLFYVPFADHVHSSALIDFAQRTGLCLRAAACEAGAETHFAADFRRGSIIIFGNEANGVSEELLSAAQHIYIPMRGHAESLNVSTAATAVLYEALRQRRTPQKRGCCTKSF